MFDQHKILALGELQTEARIIDSMINVALALQSSDDGAQDTGEILEQAYMRARRLTTSLDDLHLDRAIQRKSGEVAQ